MHAQQCEDRTGCMTGMVVGVCCVRVTCSISINMGKHVYVRTDTQSHMHHSQTHHTYHIDQTHTTYVHHIHTTFTHTHTDTRTRTHTHTHTHPSTLLALHGTCGTREWYRTRRSRLWCGVSCQVSQDRTLMIEKTLAMKCPVAM